MDRISNLIVNVNDFFEQHGIFVTEKMFIEWLSILMIVSAFIVAVGLFVLKFKISYGRYSKESIFREVGLCDES
jgi:hypothetical protein